MHLPHSKSQINKCGKALKRWWTSDDELDDRYERSFLVLFAYRARFSVPMTKVNMGLRSMVKTTTGRKPVVGQRLKRAPQILNKLVRHPNMALATMQDVGGCRAVLNTPAEVELVLRRMRKNSWTILRIDDYRTQPRHTGYRALHVVVERDGVPIEVQLRTPGQQAWATTVERAENVTGHPFKDGIGPEHWLEFFQALGDVIAATDGEYGVSEELSSKLSQLMQYADIKAFLAAPPTPRSTR